jgi:hypothetical protein
LQQPIATQQGTTQAVSRPYSNTIISAEAQQEQQHSWQPFSSSGSSRLAMELEMNPFSLAFRSPQVEGEFLQVSLALNLHHAHSHAPCISSSMLRHAPAAK